MGEFQAHLHAAEVHARADAAAELQARLGAAAEFQARMDAAASADRARADAAARAGAAAACVDRAAQLEATKVELENHLLFLQHQRQAAVRCPITPSREARRDFSPPRSLQHPRVSAALDGDGMRGMRAGLDSVDNELRRTYAPPATARGSAVPAAPPGAAAHGARFGSVGVAPPLPCAPPPPERRPAGTEQGGGAPRYAPVGLGRGPRRPGV